MRDELTSPSVEQLLIDDGLSVDVALLMAEELVDERLGPIVQYHPGHTLQPEHTDIYQYVTRTQDTTVFSDSGRADPQNTTGSSVVDEEAKLKALVEAIERYCLTLIDRSAFRVGTVNEVGKPAVDPLRFNAFSDRQLDNRGLSPESIREATYHWTCATELVSGERAFIPGQMVYLPFEAPVQVRNPTTNGAAAHTSMLQAVLGGITEAIERESLMIHYLNELRPPELDAATVTDSRFQTYYKTLERKGFEVRLLDLTLDQPVHTCLAVGYNPRQARMVDLGLGSSTSQLVAARDAVRELLQISKWKTSDTDAVQSPADIDRLERRAQYWTGRDPTDALDFWLDPPTSVRPVSGPATPPSPAKAIDIIRTWLNDEGLACYIADVTTPDVGEQGFTVVKAVIPALHPLHLVREYRYLGSERLYDIPVRMGFLETPRNEGDLNQIPHPFL